MGTALPAASGYPADRCSSVSKGSGTWSGDGMRMSMPASACKGASTCMRASALTRLCACLALDALALNRSMKPCRRAVSRVWRS
ncbi:hypothetical protein G6F65_023427 [Rhizopus arrhizus]|nr:hypothetical protein G6F65_023427 [Rhizopus arrhizus]